MGTDTIEAEKEGQPIDLIKRVAEELLSQGRQVSPTLYAIQDLSGAQPGEKYRIINQIVKAKSGKDAEKKYENLDVPVQIQDFISTKVNIEMQSTDEVIRCLKSEDKTLVIQAFKAKWFFHHNNPNLNVDFFASSIIPHISRYSRFKIIKALSRCLVASPNRAEEFFTFFANNCGVEIALPLLTACSEDFIYNEVLNRKLILPPHILLTIYKRHSKVVVRYLNLGHYRNNKNEAVRIIHKIELKDYANFIPHLISQELEYFIELCEFYWWGTYNVKIGSTLTLLFFKKAIDVFIKKPDKFIYFWPLKIIKKRLTTKQYEAMYFNLFPAEIEHFKLSNMISYLEGYSTEKKFYLISSYFKLKYQKDFVESLSDLEISITCDDLNAIYPLSKDLYEKLCVRIFPPRDRFYAAYMLNNLQVYPKEERFNLLMKTYQLKYGDSLLNNVDQLKTEKVFKLIPLDIKLELAKQILESYEIKSLEYYNNCYYLPLSECFPIYKEAIQKSSNVNDRFKYIEHMLTSSFLYNKNEDLLQVIKYYSIRHANEKVDKFDDLLYYLERKFDLKSIGEDNLIAILELFQKLSIRGELSKVQYHRIRPFFGAAAYCIYDTNEKRSVLEHENRQSLEATLIDVMIDYNIDQSKQIWTPLSQNYQVQKACLDALLQYFPTKYPPDHHMWKRNGPEKKIYTANSILDAMNDYNDAIQQGSSRNYQKYNLREYPWLFDMIKEIFDLYKTLPTFSELQQQTKKHSPELYHLLTGKSNFTVDIKSGSAWTQLKKNYNEVMVHWREYLDECRKKLCYNSKGGGPAARRFLLSAKWYNSLPVYFIEQCLKELNEPGSLKVLAIILDNDVFTSLVNDFAPKELINEYQNAKDYFAFSKSIPPAINFVNPPVPFDVIIMYCQGNYTRVAVQAFEHSIHFVSKKKIVAFADNLINKPVSVKKHGIRLLFRTVSSEEFHLFLINLLKNEKHSSIREFICTISQERLIKCPTTKNWILVQLCISTLTVQDEACLNVLSNVKKMKNKFLSEYTAEFIKKIDELAKNPEFPQAIKVKCICTLFSNFTRTSAPYLSDQIIFQLLERYYFDTDSVEIFTAAQTFAKQIFSETYLRKRLSIKT